MTRNPESRRRNMPHHTASVDTVCFTTHVDPSAPFYPDFLAVFEGKQEHASFHRLERGIPRYAHGLQINGGIQLYLSPSDKLEPNMYVRVTSKYLQYNDLHSIEGIVKTALRDLSGGGYNAPLRLSRVDFAFDFATDVLSLLESPCIHIRTKKTAFHSYHENGLLKWRLWGSSDTFKVRIYDKLKEVKTSRDMEKLYWLNVWANRGFAYQKRVHRIEFELRRKFLKEWNVNTLAELEANAGGIIAQIIEKFSITVKHGENSSRYKLVPEFQAILERHGKKFHMEKVSKDSIYAEATKLDHCRKVTQSAVKAYIKRAGVLHCKRAELIDEGKHFSIGQYNRFWLDLQSHVSLSLDFKEIYESMLDDLFKDGFVFTQIEPTRYSFHNWQVRAFQ